jgi:hypothetical protein
MRLLSLSLSHSFFIVFSPAVRHIPMSVLEPLLFDKFVYDLCDVINHSSSLDFAADLKGYM